MSDNKTSIHFAHLGYPILCGFYVNSATPHVTVTDRDDKVTCNKCNALRSEGFAYTNGKV